MASDRLKRALAAFVWGLLGRNRMVRFGQFLVNTGRLDVLDDLAGHGEEVIQQVVLSRAEEPLIVFDVGAFRGWWTESLLRVAGPAHRALEVYLFEPSEENHTILLERMSKFPQTAKLHPIKLGMSDRAGDGTFFVAGTGGTNSMVKHHLLTPDVTTETVQLTRVDLFCREHGIDGLSLLKIDTEGHDLSVLQGSEDLLSEHRIQVVQFEYNQQWISARCFLKDAIELLQAHGYCVGKVTPRGVEFYDCWHWELETFRLANFVACLPAWKPHFPQIRWWNQA